MPTGLEGVVASSTRTTYDAQGRVAYTVDPLGGLTKNDYDALGRRTMVTRYVDYLVPNPIETSAISPPGNAVVSLTTYGYDENGNQTWIQDGNNHRTDFEFDRLNRQRVVIFPEIAGVSGRKRTVTEYDGLGRRVLEWDEAGVATAFGYDIAGRLTSVTNDIKAQYTLGEGPVVTRYEYDETGNLRKEIRLVYDAYADGMMAEAPNPALLENATRTTCYEYDVLGRRTHRFLPGASLTDVPSNSGMEKTIYDKVGTAPGPYTLRKEIRDFRNQTVQYNFDAMDRLFTKILPAINSGEVQRTVTYSYTGALLTQIAETGTGVARTEYFAYDGSRRLQKKDVPEGVLSYTYNARGQVATIKGYPRSAVAVNGSPGSATPTVDALYGYDPLGRLQTIKNNKIAGNNVSTNFYDLAGNLAETSYPNTARHRWAYTEQNRLKTALVERTASGSYTLTRQYDYTLSAMGLRTHTVEKSAPTVTRREVDYKYDYAENLPVTASYAPPGSAPTEYRAPLARLNRLTRETVGTGGSAPHADYSYDLVGNRVSRTDTGVGGGANQTFAYNAKDQFTGTSEWAFDANGNTTGSQTGAVTDSYDAENRLVKRMVTGVGAKTITMGYDSAGNRVRKRVDSGGASKTLYYLVDEKNPTGYAQNLAEYVDNTAAPSPANASLYVANEFGLSAISMTFPTGGTYYIGHDGQGSVRFLMSPSNGTIATASGLNYEWDYDAWGNLLNTPANVADVEPRYTGEHWDKDLGLYYLRARFYSPTHGRFWNADSYEGRPTAPTSLHKYLYCGNDPINRIDPSGNEDIAQLTVGNAIRQIFVSGSMNVTANAAISRIFKGPGAYTVKEATWDFFLGGTMGVGTPVFTRLVVSKIGISSMLPAISYFGIPALKAGIATGEWAWKKTLIEKEEVSARGLFAVYLTATALNVIVDRIGSAGATEAAKLRSKEFLDQVHDFYKSGTGGNPFRHWFAGLPGAYRKSLIAAHEQIASSNNATSSRFAMISAKLADGLLGEEGEFFADEVSKP